MTIDILIDRTENFKTLTQKEKVKHVAYFYQLLKKENSFSAGDIGIFFSEAKIDAPSNIGDVLSKLLKDKPRDIIKPNGKFSLERHYIKQMDSKYLQMRSEKVVDEMTLLLKKIKKEEQKEFLEDALNV